MECTTVKLSVALGEEVVQLSTLDQQAQRAYANLLLVFKLSQNADADHVFSSLKRGLGAALTEVPDFASLVVPVPGSKKNELQLRLGPDSGVPFKLVRQDALASHLEKHSSGGTYAELARDNFPLASVPTELLFNQLPASELACARGLPGLLAQASVVDGGLIMGLSWHHTVSDARGINTLLSSWARHTKMWAGQGTIGSPSAAPEPTRDRWRLTCGPRDVHVSHFSDYQINAAARTPLSPAAAHLLDRPDTTNATAGLSTWYFSKKALSSLRGELGRAAADGSDAVQFTSGEAVSALVWKHLSLARLLHQQLAHETSLFASRIDFRGRAKPAFADGYIGNINEPNARTRMRLAEVCAPSSPASLVALAAAVREAIGAMDEKTMREFIGLVEGSSSVTDVYWDYNTFPGPDLVVTDMSGMDTLRQEWGGDLGQPVCIRSGSREKGVAYFLPQDAQGGFEVQLQCTAEDLGRLKDDSLFTKYAEFRS
ncbi:Transferase [Cordyceps militaris CM01]|uniref:Acyltransferase cm3D n=1 Tax=Cordyceps militaris (strain CM01) TaxID=983644 RepID=CM3D_CORMM|nr:Transferase [Cordyceps militaris CM01]G3J454.1 RecName: Full=Acyltransferase cm3D; AltName: Full=Beauveriolides biosynthesis cluster protein D; AltName: Full=Cyclodepsipeptides cm3 biosynthesis cluster protein D [Cordyceps militaris CM01]EGX96625.1 Transferase [Cordyceps militaris CM01]